MAGRKRDAPAESTTPRVTRSSARAGATAGPASPSTASPANSRRTKAGRNPAVPDIYRELLAEARDENETVSQDTDVAERPPKRRRPGERRVLRQTDAPTEDTARTRKHGHTVGDDAGDDEDVEFEDVVLPTPTVQTVDRESDESDDDEIDFEDVVIAPAASSAPPAGEESKGLTLDLSAHLAAMGPRRADRRKAMSKEEKERRVQIHKMHILCLLSHVERRNRWCNDPRVQDALRLLIPQKTVSALVPRASLTQFGRTESLRRGLQEAKDIFKRSFVVTERGLRRALWAEDEEQLKNVRSRHLCPGVARLIHTP